jgi:filamentous hemagglutinin family protein
MYHYNFKNLLLILFGSIAILMGPCHAQITLDGSLGPGGALSGPHYMIGNELGQTAGDNLFHSFGEFNIQVGESATFTGPAHIANIIGRVTGGHLSTINGALNSKIPNADLYLLNPSGVFMGSHAKLNIDGAFHLSSTDYLQFTDGYQFDVYTANPLLTVASPKEFGFLNQIGDINIVGSQLENGDNDLSITAGNLQIRSIKIEITNPAGKTESITLGDITTTTQDGQAGNIRLKADESLVIIGSRIVSQTEQGGSGHTGNVTLVSPQIYLDSHAQIEDGSIIKFGGVQVGTRTQGSGNGGDIQILAEQLFLVNDSAVFAETHGSGSGGNVTLEAAQLVIAQTVQQEEGVKISARAYSQGQSGTINVVATDSISIQGNPQQLGSTFLTADTKGQGNGGNIVISTPDLKIDAGILQAATFAEGNAGNITLKVDQLTLSNGAKLEVSSAGIGQAGNITIAGLSNEKVNTITIVGESDEQPEPQPSGISSSAENIGDSGTIRISAKTVNLDQRGTLQTQSLGSGQAGDIILKVQDLTIAQGADIDASNEGTNPEKGGNISIEAATILMTAEHLDEENQNQPFAHNGFLGGIYSVTNTDGHGGDISLTAQQLELRDGGVISVKSEGGLGNAGDLNLSITDNLRMNNAAILTSAMHAGGGNIEIDKTHNIHLINSEISAEASGTRKQDNGGNLTLHNLGPLTLDNSQLLANAYAGNGGYIDIRTAQLEVFGESQLNVSSELGFNGEFILNSTKLRDDFMSLPPPQFQGLDLSLDRCAGLTRDDLSRFVITIRDVLPSSPTDLQTHYYFP